MFQYYGSKKSYVDKYPEPIHSTIIEPFAGSASYSMKYWNHNVILCEKNVDLYNIWDYLINKATTKRIKSLPILNENENINDKKFNHLKESEKNLIGYFMHYGASPGRKPSSKKYGFNKWNETTINKLSNDLKKIKHWKIFNVSYEDLNTNFKTTWFIDPPYQGKGGTQYKNGNKDIDYKHLSKFVKSCKGQVIACENEESNWLPFKPLTTAIQNHRKHTEMIYYKINK